MRTYVKVSMLAVVTASLLASATMTASATRLSLSNKAIRIVWDHLFDEAKRFECSVTMEGSFHERTFTKASGALLGNISRAFVGHPCIRDSAWFLNGSEVINGTTAGNTLPWHIRYDQFQGTLPAITSALLQILGMGILIEELGLSCLYLTGAGAPWKIFMNVSGGLISGVQGSNVLIPKASGSGLCPMSIFLGGEGRVFLLGTTTMIRVTLI